MKTTYFFAIIFSALTSLFAVSCTPELERVEDNRKTEPALISKVVLKPNHLLLTADGHAQIDLTPLVYIKAKDKDKMLNFDRVRDEWLEYITESGDKISRRFSTSDHTLVGKTMKVKVKIKGTSVVSNTASFRIVPKQENQQEDAVFPVVFHIIQTSREIEQLAIPYDKQFFYNILNKLDNAFAGKLSNNPVGTDTHVRFRAAKYSPTGDLLSETGINRVAVATIPSGVDVNDIAKKAYDKLIEENNLLWDPSRYLNIWLISDAEGAATAFGAAHSARCKPRYAYKNTVPIEGLDMIEYSPESVFSVAESGVLYKLQLINEQVRSYDVYSGQAAGNNELVYYVGQYLGLLPNNIWEAPYYGDDPPPPQIAEDYCNDTMPYVTQNLFYKENKTTYKETETCFFLSENIMDDPTGMHISVSQDQSRRIWRVLKTCPERAAWKSSFAFEGK